MVLFSDVNFTWTNETVPGALYVSSHCPGICEEFNGFYLTPDPVAGHGFRALESWMKADELDFTKWYFLFTMPGVTLTSGSFPGCKVYHDEVDFYRLKCKTQESLDAVVGDHQKVKYLMSLPNSINFLDGREILRHRYSNYREDNPYRAYFPTRDLQTPVYPGVLVTDTGLDYFHCSFFDANQPVPVLGGFSTSAHAKILGYLKGEYGDYIAVTNAHGTSVSSLVNGRACGTFTGGSCTGCKLAFLDMSIGDSSLIVPYHLRTISEDLLANYNVRVHSMSWGDTSSGGRYNAVSYLIDDIGYRNKRLIHVCAAGNTGPEGRILPPATAKMCISVGAEASFSSVGPMLDGRPGPVLVYGGVAVRTAAARYPQSTQNHQNTVTVDGTSFSAPVVAAMIAAMIPGFTSHYGYDPEFSDILSIVQILPPPFTGYTDQYHTQSVSLNTELCFRWSSSTAMFLSFAWADPPTTNYPKTFFRYAIFINDVAQEMLEGNRIIYYLVASEFNLTVVSLTSGEQPKVTLHITRETPSLCQGDGVVDAAVLTSIRDQNPPRSQTSAASTMQSVASILIVITGTLFGCNL